MNRPLQDPDDHLLDASGLLCPEPVMLMHHRMRDLPVDDILLVLATDPSTRRDIPDFCRFLGHELLEQDEVDGIYRYRVRKQGNA